MTCPHCKAPVNENDVFCQTCGKRLVEEPKQPVMNMPTAGTIVPQQPNVKNIAKVDNKIKDLLKKYNNKNIKKYLIPILVVIIFILFLTTIIAMNKKPECPKCTTNETNKGLYYGMSDYKLGSYSYKAPSTWTFTYNEENDSIKFMDDDQKYIGEIKIDNEKYSTIRGDIGNYISELEENGYLIDSYNEQAFDSNSVYVIDGKYKNDKVAIYYMDGGESSIIANVTFDNTQEFTAKNNEIIKTLSTFKIVDNPFKIE